MKRMLTFALLIAVSTGTASLTAADQGPQKFKFGFAERFRFVSWDNAIYLDDDSGETFSFTRHRTNLMFNWLPSRFFELAVKLTNEHRVYLSPKKMDFEINELVFDNLYLKIKKPGNLPLTLTLGRQNIMLGEGFVVMDGNPLTGSRTIYFNALRADYAFAKNQNLTLFYAYMPTTDTILPVINDLDQPLIEKPEKGLGLYYRGSFGKTGLEAYYIRKDVEGVDTLPMESGFNTLGARLIQPLAGSLSITAEGAYQFGSYFEFDRSALGGYFHLDWTLPVKISPFKKLTLGGIYLKGDDPRTNDMEGWDPVFSRWPKWSESYIYTLVRENRVAYWSNLTALYASLYLEFGRSMNLLMSYYFLGADQANPAVFPGGAGTNRGQLFISRLNFKINKHTSGHFLWENFTPGDFYFDGADGYNWLRFEIMFRF